MLLARRPAGRHMAGLWEFPGGKVHDGESPQAALERELAEELDVDALIGDPITFAVHEEPGLRILLLFYAGRPRWRRTAAAGGSGDCLGAARRAAALSDPTRRRRAHRPVGPARPGLTGPFPEPTLTPWGTADRAAASRRTS